jgi:hypothetical protein
MTTAQPGVDYCSRCGAEPVHPGSGLCRACHAESQRDALAEAVRAALGTMNYYFGPLARTACDPTKYNNIVAALLYAEEDR